MQEFGTIKLARASLTVSGLVVGPDGKPVAGAEVFGIDGPTRFATKSATDGSFTLTGYYAGIGYVFVRQAGCRFAAVPVQAGGKEKITITLMPADAPPVVIPNGAEHRAALDKFTRHALTLVWESHPASGWGGNALHDMARIDLATAKKWRDEEKKRTNGQTDYSRLINSAIREKTLFDTAKNDIDEAIATLSTLKVNEGFQEAKQLGERMLAVDKAKAARLAEEAVVRARQREIPAKLWSLAEAGDLAIRAGNAAGGKKILLEAAELAGKLVQDDEGSNAFAVGMVAARLAPHDWAKAEALLKSMKKPSEYNRFLAGAVARIASNDLAKAKEILSGFKPDNSSYSDTAHMRVAFAIAKSKPDEAVTLIESVKEKYYQFLGYIQLAKILAPTDKARAVKLIDTAFDLLDLDPSAYRSYSAFGGGAGLAAVGAVRAKEIGYPDVAALVARALALRPTGQEAGSPDARARSLVNIAAAIALVDPASARNVLAGIDAPDEFIARAMSQDRDWLFAPGAGRPRAGDRAGRQTHRPREERPGCPETRFRIQAWSRFARFLQPTICSRNCAGSATCHAKSTTTINALKTSTRGIDMTLLLLSAILAAPAEPPGDWKFIDESTRDGRSVLTFHTIELADAPTRPLHPDDKPPVGSKYGSIGVGPGGRHRLDVLWHADSNTLWFDADGDGRFAATERHALTDKPLEAKVAISFGDGAKRDRTILLRKRGDGVAWAVRGYTSGSVTLAGKKLSAKLTDGNADGCFDGAGTDRVWLDLDGDGKFDPLAEQFPLGTAITANGTAILVRPRADGLGAELRERPTETGALRVEIARLPKAEVVDLNVNYVSEFGELIVAKAAGQPTPLPAGKYRIDSVRLKLSDGDGKVWHYSFASSNAAYDIKIVKEKEFVHRPLDGLKVAVSFATKDIVKPGGSVVVQPDVVAGGLYMTRCEVGTKFVEYGREVSAEINLTEPGSVTLDHCKTGFR